MGNFTELMLAQVIAMNITLLIDADNSPAKYIHSILIKLAGYGTVNIRRAYGNWASPHLNGWQAVIHEHAIQPIQQYEVQPDNSMLKASHGSFQYSPF